MINPPRKGRVAGASEINGGSEYITLNGPVPVIDVTWMMEG